jgi:hypothetical protein
MGIVVQFPHGPEKVAPVLFPVIVNCEFAPRLPAKEGDEH